MSYQDKYELLEEKEIKEINSHARLYIHKKTNARILSLQNNDENKVFSINFRTPPKDNTGVAHILEHSVLCGSKKYNVKEPFVELLKSSLQTFLNAITFPDKTCYPVASQNLQDFYNLMDVYLDSVFYPKLARQTFEQEGWHYEVSDPKAPLKYKGVVFNEMKGSYSSPESLLYDYSQMSIFPDSTYGFDAGGDPKVIPDLTYENFTDFHKKYYHPSNAFIFFYGDNDEYERLEKLSHYLDQFDLQKIDSDIKIQTKLKMNQRVIKSYSASNESNPKSFLTVNWLLPDTFDAELNLNLRILDYILTGMPGSPLRKALIDSGLGEDLAGVGLESDIRQMYYSTGMRGIDSKDLSKVERLIKTTLKKLVEDGIDKEIIKAAINSLEFALRENNTGSFPRGMAVMFRALTTWLYDDSPFTLMEFSDVLENIKTRLDSGERIFEDLINKFLIENEHRSVVILEPDQGLEAMIQEEETQQLQEARLRMTDEEIHKIIQKNAELKQFQEASDDPQELARIPRLQRSDMEEKVKTVPREVTELKGVETLIHPLPTNGIYYFDLGFDLHFLPQKYLPYIPLFGRALVEMGTKDKDFVNMTTLIRQKTGGLSPVVFSNSIKGQKSGACRLFLRAKALPDNVPDLFQIIREIIKEVDLGNRDRFKQILLEEKSAMEQSLVPAGHRFVGLRLKSRYSEADWAQEHMSGLSYLLFLRHLIKMMDKDWDKIKRDLNEIGFLLFHKDAMLVNITAEDDLLKKYQIEAENFLDSIDKHEISTSTWVSCCEAGNEGIFIPAQVNYVGKTVSLANTKYNFHGSSLVASRFLRASWLWDQIRVQGGAYGAFGSYDYLSNIMTFASYRDPNIIETLNAFAGCGSFLIRKDLNEDEVEKAVIGAIGEMDSYQLPDAKGFSSAVRYLTNIDDDHRQKVRNEILSTSLDHFQEFGRTLETAFKEDPGMICVIGGHDQVEKASETITLDNKFRII
ncbi:insulinase family protein [Desulfonatronovibrio magnus]|uniref:insulinase family protein n=1 Tax=Desulfonatronovibrio magnus TaxID=698827 RepID=UPI000B2703C8|nr:insulinase family protein [Desulfonatronovibrio magnus]